MSINTIVKSDGTVVAFEPEKLHKWASFASDNEVEWSSIVLDAYKKCYDGCSTKDIQQAMISACVEREDEKHLRMAGRLLLGGIYKEAHGGYNSIPTLKDFFHSMINRGLWTEMDYSDEELDKLEGVIDHSKNLSKNYSYTALKQMRDKYMNQDLISRKCFESPQFMFMGVALNSMEQQPKETRLDNIAKTYEYLSDLKINLSTPMLVNLRTPKKGLASCCVYTTKDTAESLATGDHIAYMMTCASAGIGSHLTTRSIGDPVRNGAVIHQGKLPYLRMIQSSVHANKQACYDDKTKVLTNTGFKLFKDLNDDDLVAQVHDDGTVDFVEPIEGFVYNFTGSLVNFNAGNTNQLPVTPNHTMIYSDLRVETVTSVGTDVFDNKQFKESRADELIIENGIAFKVSAHTQNRDSSNLDKLDLLMGVLLSHKYLYNEKTGILSIHVGEGQETIENLMRALDIKFIGEQTDGYITAIEYEFEDPTAFIKGRMETFLTRVSTMMITEFVEFLQHISSWKGNIRIFNEMQKEYLQAILSISGKYFVTNFNSGCITVVDNITSHEDATVFEVEDYEYDGKVYCLQVPTNKLIVQREDLTLICGNSRGGANTTYFSVLDPEINDLIALKNPTTIQQKRIRDIDYAMNVNKLFVEKVARNEEWYTISYHYAKDLHDAFYSSDYELFKMLYENYKDHEHAVHYKARDIALKALTESVETGRLYITYIDEANRHTPFAVGSGAEDDKIYSSNLCVSPETEILTRDGYQNISALKDKDVEVWNGEEWSKTTVRQTGVEQKLITVKLSNGSKIECTPYHKFVLQSSTRGPVTFVEAKDLEVGDKLIKHDLALPKVDENEGEDFPHPYLNGFYTGDGTVVSENIGRIYFYKDKKKLAFEEEFNFSDAKISKYEDLRYHIEYPFGEVLKEKYTIPNFNVKLNDKISWLAGLFDSDGCIYSNGDRKQLVLINTNKEFLYKVMLFLQEIGIHSKVLLQTKEGMFDMPVNDGTGETKPYFCNAVWRLMISNNSFLNLIEMGIKFKRLDNPEMSECRSSLSYVKVDSIEDHGRYDDTYCFTEEKRHMGMFNGVLTGQCEEIFLVTKGFPNIQDLYREEISPSSGEIGLCSLSSIVMGRVSEEEYEDVAYHTLLLVDNTLEIMDYPFPSLRSTARKRRNIGIGMTNLAYDIASRGLSYTTQEGKNYIHQVAERHAYYLYKGSLRLAKEKGNAEWMHKTKYPQGWLPIDTYNKNVDSVVENNLNYDWETLRKEIIDQGGIRNSTVTAIPPNESSSLLTNTTNSIYPIRSLRVIKTSGTNRNILLAPDYETLKDKYDIAWNMKSKDLIELYAIVQKFTDQGISSDLYVTYKDSQLVSSRDLLSDFILMAKLGCKSRYYINSQSGVDIKETEVIDTSDQCDSCVL